MAEASQESKLDVPAPFSEGQAAGQQPGSAAGARGGGTAEAKARPNVEVNRRAEGTSELNRRLGDGVKGAAALERCGVAGDYDLGWAGWQAACCAAALQESKHCVPVSFHETKAAGQQPGSVAGARGSGAAGAKARPNVEVNRRAEGTSELNRRLGAVGQGAAALERCGVAGVYGRGCAGRRAQCAHVVRRWQSSRPATE